MLSYELREAFLRYFESKGHRILPSSPLVPHNDPTLLFTNAGMVQFKDIFTGKERTNLKRVTTSQKCIRAGGKHNDLENVGYTARHHTFFEMLGNFSFGDYFKKEAIAFAYEFLTEVIKLDKSKFYVTIYKDDEEAFKLWQDIAHIEPSRIFKMGEKDNFWAMGDTGPCGPCSEIIYDQGKDVGCKRTECNVGCDCDRFLEIWNLVFMQFERHTDGSMSPLPRPSIDTGMGLERLTAVIQNKLSNFDTDIFKEIIETTSDIANVKYHTSEKVDISLRVIADHSRAATFLISDGVLPSNEGRGYVLRRIIRRAIRHGHLLGIREIFFYKICEAVVKKMGGYYQELKQNLDLIIKATRYEEERFRETLEKGLDILKTEFDRLKKENINTIAGEIVFKLYDTYGFPVDLTSIIAKENGFVIDTLGFEREMERQRERSEWRGSGESEVGHVYKELKNRNISTVFTGYAHDQDNGKLIGIIHKGALTESIDTGAEAELVFDKTPFYGESGGQVGDCGTIEGDNILFEIKDTKKIDDIIIHKGILKIGKLKLGDNLLLKIDSYRRSRIRAAHSATHLLHSSLRKILGDHIKQAGSLVEADRLRFDFSHFEQIPDDILEKIEEDVNSQIIRNLEVKVEIKETKEAINEGAIALFGEKYGDKVRVVSMGDSIELCGGTHVRYTGEIGLFYILKESAIASGIRRIEAICGINALKHIGKERKLFKKTTELLKVSEDKIVETIEQLKNKIAEYEKEITNYEDKLFSFYIKDIISSAIEIEGLRAIISEVKAKDVSDLRKKMDLIREREKDTIIFLYSKINDKISLVMNVPKDKTDRVDANSIVKDVSTVIGGTGGGRRDMAQGGGSDISKIDLIKEKVITSLRKAISNI
ncbi:MAG: alanine--tRNA ligase [Deltaproteobacteria bacterium]|nr:alanine--tRNA ligase [Deltaproteobacteria bacterium]